MSDITFGQYIARLREEKKMSQRGLAEAAGLINSTISRIETDSVKPDPTTIEKIATALKIDKTLLFVKCGYSEIPEDFVVIARKTGDLTEEQRKEVYKIFNDTIDKFLSDDDDKE